MKSQLFFDWLLLLLPFGCLLLIPPFLDALIIGSNFIMDKVLNGEAFFILFLDIVEKSIVLNNLESHQSSLDGKYTYNCAMMLLAIDIADSYYPIRISLLNLEIYFFKFIVWMFKAI